MQLYHPEATQQALSILRSGNNFNWTIITLLAFVVYVYMSEIEKKNWKAIAAGLALYMTHWLFEIVNALICKFSGHALWTVPGGTSFLILVGVGIELSFMFAVAGIILTKLLPEDPKTKILGLGSRWFFAIANAALFAIIEIFLAKTPVFIWVYPWWGSLPVFILVYIPFFLAANYAYYWEKKKQIRFIGGLFILNVILMVVFAVILQWI
jgi:hypothetical protein